MLETKDLSFNYTPNTLFNFPDVTVNTGSQLLLLGASGTGKTTWLHLIAGLRKPQAGSIDINNQSITSMGQRDLDRFRSKNIGVIFQNHHLINSLSALENVMLPTSFAKNITGNSLGEKILSKLGLTDRLHSLPSALSQGEQQRVSIARALINNPGLILADEPTSSLDDNNCQAVAELLLEHSKSSALVIITHDKRLKDLIHNTISL